MKKIYKYTFNLLDIAGYIIKKVSYPADVLSVISQQPNTISVWAVVDTESKEKRDIEILVYGTGQELKHSLGDYCFLDSIQDADGFHIWHIFEKIQTQFYCD